MISETSSTQALIQNWTLITGNIFPDRHEGPRKSKDPHLEEMRKVSRATERTSQTWSQLTDILIR
jgi:hypothetical protein